MSLSSSSSSMPLSSSIQPVNLSPIAGPESVFTSAKLQGLAGKGITIDVQTNKATINGRTYSVDHAGKTLAKMTEEQCKMVLQMFEDLAKDKDVMNKMGNTENKDVREWKICQGDIGTGNILDITGTNSTGVVNLSVKVKKAAQPVLNSSKTSAASSSTPLLSLTPAMSSATATKNRKMKKNTASQQSDQSTSSRTSPDSSSHSSTSHMHSTSSKSVSADLFADEDEQPISPSSANTNNNANNNTTSNANAKNKNNNNKVRRR